MDVKDGRAKSRFKDCLQRSKKLAIFFRKHCKYNSRAEIAHPDQTQLQIEKYNSQSVSNVISLNDLLSPIHTGANQRLKIS